MKGACGKKGSRKYPMDKEIGLDGVLAGVGEEEVACGETLTKSKFYLNRSVGNLNRNLLVKFGVQRINR